MLWEHRLCYNTWYGPAYKKWGSIHKSFSFLKPFRLSQNQWQKNIWLLSLCKSSDHFDMLIHSLQTAGICTCINSNISFSFFFFRHRGLSRNRRSVWSPMKDCSVFFSDSWKNSLTNSHPVCLYNLAEFNLRRESHVILQTLGPLICFVSSQDCSFRKGWAFSAKTQSFESYLTKHPASSTSYVSKWNEWDTYMDQSRLEFVAPYLF